MHTVAGAKTWNKAIQSTQVNVIKQASLTKLKTLFLTKKINYMVYTLDNSGFFNAQPLKAKVMDKPLLTVKTYHYIHKKHQAIAIELASAINDEFIKLNATSKPNSNQTN